MRGESKKRSVASMRALAAAAIATVYVVWQTMPAVSAAPTPAANSAAGAEAAVGAAAGVRSPVRNFESPEPTLRSAALSTGTAASASKATGTNRHTYECRGTECSICHFDVAEVAGRHQPFSDGSIAQDRVNGTVISAQQLEDEGIRYLQVGGDWWNTCGDGWLNADMVFTRVPSGVICESWRSGRLIMRLLAGRRFPFEDGSFDAVYSEHMFEHILPMDGAFFLAEAWRILRPGGVLRVTTPDLEKYLNGYVHRATNRFLFEHAEKYPPMGKLGKPYTAATIVNNIFRNYEHRWVYDFEEIVRTAQVAHIPESAVRRSSRLGDDLPPSLLAAFAAASLTTTARHQAGRRENPTRCWLEQEVREAESVYITITKPAG